jgi:hypothetical protein
LCGHPDQGSPLGDGRTVAARFLRARLVSGQGPRAWEVWPARSLPGHRPIEEAAMVRRTPTRTRPEGPLLPQSGRHQGAATPVAALHAAVVSPGSASTPCRPPGERWWFVDAGDEWDRAHRVAEQVDVVAHGRPGACSGEVAAGRRPCADLIRVGPVRRALQRASQGGSQTCIGDAVTLTSGGGGVSC